MVCPKIKVSILLIWGLIYAQESMPIIGTFKGTRLYNTHTVEMPGKEVLEYRIAHRFGPITDGLYNFLGIDNGAIIQMSLGYGITDNWEVGISRTSTDKLYQGYVKYRLLQQKTEGMPVSVAFLGSAYYTTLRDPAYQPWERRFSYLTQILIARKMGRFSLQISPTWIHYNYDVYRVTNDLIGLWGAFRVGITNRVAITGEIAYPFTDEPEEGNGFYPVGSIGVDIETGGHVFQLAVSSAPTIAEPQLFTPKAPQFRIGFNISRVFTLGDGQ